MCSNRADVPFCCPVSLFCGPWLPLCVLEPWHLRAECFLYPFIGRFISYSAVIFVFVIKILNSGFSFNLTTFCY